MDHKPQRRVIFLSHASEDREFAVVLQKAIEDAFPGAFEIFNAFERDSIAPSDEWRDKLNNAVKESSLLLVLLTPNSIGKNWIYWESGGAYHRGIPVVPIVGVGCEVRHLPGPFREIQAVTLQSEDGLRRMMDRLAQLSGMSHLSERYDLSQVVREISALQIRHVGKQWSQITEGGLGSDLLIDFSEAWGLT